MAQIETPCIQVCTIDWRSGQCMGCGRTRAEIAGWTKLSDDERTAVMQELPARLETLLTQLRADAERRKHQ